MPQAIINLTKEENEKVKSYSKFWKLSKHETILRMIREFEGELIIAYG